MNKIDFANVLLKVAGVITFLFAVSLLPSITNMIIVQLQDIAILQTIQLLIFALMSFILIKYSDKITQVLFKNTQNEIPQTINLSYGEESFIFWIKIAGLFAIISSISQVIAGISAILYRKITLFVVLYYLIKPIFGIYLLLDGSLIYRLAYSKKKEVEQVNQ